jgi:hypothetical protein
MLNLDTKLYIQRCKNRRSPSPIPSPPTSTQPHPLSLKASFQGNEIAIPSQSSKTLAFQSVAQIARGELGDQDGRIVPEEPWYIIIPFRGNPAPAKPEAPEKMDDEVFLCNTLLSQIIPEIYWPFIATAWAVGTIYRLSFPRTSMS